MLLGMVFFVVLGWLLMIGIVFGLCFFIVSIVVLLCVFEEW